MHILHILPRLTIGGIEKSVCAFLKKATVTYPDVKHTVVAASGPLKTSLPQKVTYIPLNLHRKDPASLFLNGIRLARLARVCGVDIMHAQSRGPCWSTLMASRLTSIPWVSSIHGAHKIQNKLKHFYNSSELRASCVISLSTFLVRYIHAHYAPFEENVIPIISGIDTDYFTPALIPHEEIAHWRKSLSHNEPLLVMPGRLTAIKGHNLLLEALAILRQQGENFHCVFIGPTKGAEAYVTALKMHIQNLRLVESVRFEEARQDLRSLMCAADVVVAPSIHPEAFGCVVAEACALERCVVASDLGGFQEIIENNKTGWLFKPSHAADLAEALHHVLHLSNEERTRIGQQARKRIETHFSLDRYVQQMIDVYCNTLQG
ncbi:MAG: glycosyltransferase family 4 protein [Holosporales bacterium]|jgi:glycosyltransferase involved in cell wall biosynthesis|nr:glycosyltransferase family 4 protein [Holosporales bacterium]